MVSVQTNDNRTRTPAEVKQFLHELAFILRASQRIKTEVVESAERSYKRSVRFSRGQWAI